MKAKLNWIIPEPTRTPGTINTSLGLDFETVYSIYNDSVIDKDYYNYVKGKKVIIVGPAGYLRGLGRGKFIDDFDIIVRLNRSFPIEEVDFEDLGSQTHIRYHNGSTNPVEGGPLHLDKVEGTGLKYISSVFPRHLDYFDHHIKVIEKEMEEAKTSVKLHCYTDIEQFITFHHMMQTRPNAGIATILDLINYDPSQLHISGMTFFTGKSYIDTYSEKANHGAEHHINRQLENHAQGPQMDMVKLLFDNLDFITMDDEVKQSFGGNR